MKSSLTPMTAEKDDSRNSFGSMPPKKLNFEDQEDEEEEGIIFLTKKQFKYVLEKKKNDRIRKDNKAYKDCCENLINSGNGHQPTLAEVYNNSEVSTSSDVDTHCVLPVNLYFELVAKGAIVDKMRAGREAMLQRRASTPETTILEKPETANTILEKAANELTNCSRALQRLAANPAVIGTPVVHHTVLITNKDPPAAPKRGRFDECKLLPVSPKKKTQKLYNDVMKDI